MGATDRKKLIKTGEKLLSGPTPTDRAGMLSLCEDLLNTAQEIVDDFEEQRDNFGTASGLLESWEENYGCQQDGWDSAVVSLDDIKSRLEEAEETQMVRCTLCGGEGTLETTLETDEEPTECTQCGGTGEIEEEVEFDPHVAFEEIESAWQEGVTQ